MEAHLFPLCCWCLAVVWWAVWLQECFPGKKVEARLWARYSNAYWCWRGFGVLWVFLECSGSSLWHREMNYWCFSVFLPVFLPFFLLQSCGTQENSLCCSPGPCAAVINYLCFLLLLQLTQSWIFNLTIVCTIKQLFSFHPLRWSFSDTALWLGVPGGGVPKNLSFSVWIYIE